MIDLSIPAPGIVTLSNAIMVGNGIWQNALWHERWHLVSDQMIAEKVAGFRSAEHWQLAALDANGVVVCLVPGCNVKGFIRCDQPPQNLDPAKMLAVAPMISVAHDGASAWLLIVAGFAALCLYFFARGFVRAWRADRQPTLTRTLELKPGDVIMYRPNFSPLQRRALITALEGRNRGPHPGDLPDEKAVAASLDDIEAGRTRPVRDFANELRNRGNQR